MAGRAMQCGGCGGSKWAVNHGRRGKRKEAGGAGGGGAWKGGRSRVQLNGKREK